MVWKPHYHKLVQSQTMSCLSANVLLKALRSNCVVVKTHSFAYLPQASTVSTSKNSRLRVLRPQTLTDLLFGKWTITGMALQLNWNWLLARSVPVQHHQLRSGFYLGVTVRTQLAEVNRKGCLTCQKGQPNKRISEQATNIGR